ncbi:hypothetical protein GOV05_04150 [Candidatus Woesearchaeota archaeon]|nr:hypothetical protein [Candidatus Woesearchaeota archaeon]
MANAIVTFKIMPESPDSNIENISSKAQETLVVEGAKGDTKVEVNEVAFGIKEVMVLGMFEVTDRSFDEIAEKLNEIEEVNSANVYKMDLAMG